MTSLKHLRQCAAEVLAYAVTELFSETTLVGGKVTEFGFYYDFIAEQQIDEQAIHLIEEKIRGIAKEDSPLRMLEMMRENAATLFEHKGQPIRAQAVRTACTNIVTIFHLDQFYDYCPPLAIEGVKEVLALKILTIERVVCYLAEEGHVDVIRIHGAVSFDKNHLKKHLKSIQAGKKVDHRRIGKEMRLFEEHEEAGACAWFWLSNGTRLRHSLYEFWKGEHQRQRFELVVSPLLMSEMLAKKSGLFDRFSETMDASTFSFEEMNYYIPHSLAPFHALLFRQKPRTHHEMPLRYAECARTHAVSEDGKLWGVLNSQFSESDHAHIFCAPGQIEEELISSLQFIDKFIKIFGFEYYWCLKGSARKSASRGEHWKTCFANALKTSGFEYAETETDEDVGELIAQAILIDSLGREWKGPRVSIDVNCPARFNLRYQGNDDKMHVPVLVTRSLFGSIERFAAILTEHYAGQFPVWLAPEQVRVIPVLESHSAYAESVHQALEHCGYRSYIDHQHERLGNKIHKAKHECVPYMAIVGDKEEKFRLINVRSHSQETSGTEMTLEEFLMHLQNEVLSRSLFRMSWGAK